MTTQISSSADDADRVLEAATRLQWLSNFAERPTLPPEISTESVQPDLVKEIADLTDAPADNPIIKAKAHHFAPAAYRAVRFDGKPRNLEMPHPVPYFALVEYLRNNWSDIEQFMNKTHSKASVNITETDRRIITFGQNYHKKTIAQTVQINSGLRKRSNHPDIWSRPSKEAVKGKILEFDISNFFPSIYTHAIEWVIDKSRSSTEGSLGYDLDKKVRALRTGRTDGLSIAPVTSNIIAEILLNDLDNKLIDMIETDTWPSKLNNAHSSVTKANRNTQILIHYSRAIDDMAIWLKNSEDPEEIQAEIIRQLSKVGLTLNHAKTRFYSFFEYRRQHISSRTHRAMSVLSTEFSERDVEMCFAQLEQNAKESPGSSMLKYGWKLIKTAVLNNLKPRTSPKRRDTLKAFINCSWMLCVEAPHLIPDLVGFYDQLPASYDRFIRNLTPYKLIYDLLISESRKQNTETLCWLIAFAQRYHADDSIIEFLHISGFFDADRRTLLSESWLDSFVALMLLHIQNDQINERLAVLFSDRLEDGYPGSADRQLIWSDFWPIRYQLFREGLLIANHFDDYPDELEVFKILKKYNFSLFAVQQR